MKERPILFSAPMVRALLYGSKTQTRRVLNEAKTFNDYRPYVNQRWEEGSFKFETPDGMGITIGMRSPFIAEQYSPYGRTDNHLWVREAWRTYASLDGTPPRDIAPGAGIQYEALGTNIHGDKGNYLLGMGKYRPSMFMPRWASRITLEITKVRVERLQDISETDAEAEGIQQHSTGLWLPCSEPGKAHIDPRRAYRDLWESINGPGSWDLNPWLWVIQFKCNNSQTTKETL